MRRRTIAGTLRATALAALVLVAAGCGGGGTRDGDDSAEPLVVSAASSLTDAFTAYGERFEQRADAGTTRVRFSFAGSDELAAQIRQGVRPDVFASASTELPAALHAEGLVERPVVFATNDLVLAVPADSDRVMRLADLTRPGSTVAIGSESVPVGAYTREVLGRLGERRAQAVLANVRTNEPDTKGIVGKLLQGAVDAGFLYGTDVSATNGKLRGIRLAGHLRPRVAYAAAVVAGAPHPAAARAFVRGLVRGAGQAALRARDFGAPPPNAP